MTFKQALELGAHVRSKLGIEAMGQVATELVYGDLQHETRFLGFLRGCG